MLISGPLIFLMAFPSRSLYQKPIFYTRDQSLGIFFYFFLSMHLFFSVPFCELLYLLWLPQRFLGENPQYRTFPHVHAACWIQYRANANLKKRWKRYMRRLTVMKNTASTLYVFALVWRALIISQMTLQWLSLILQRFPFFCWMDIVLTVKKC